MLLRGATTDGPVRINLGSGKQVRDGWIGYDRARTAALGSLIGRDVLGWPRSTRVRDLTKGIPHRDGTVDAIYSSHTLEHLSRGAARFVVEEAFRVLKPGGTLRLVVPDLEVLVRAYHEDDRDTLPTGEPTAADAFMEALGMRSCHSGDGLLLRTARRLLRSDDGGHKWMYDGESLAWLVRDVGFADVERVDFREGRDVEAAALDHRSAFHVHLEAFKP